MNEQNTAMYRRLMEAEARLEDIRRHGGVSEAALGEALEASEADPARSEQEGVYLEALIRYVAQLGGHLELRAVFPTGSMELRRWASGDG